MTEEEEESPGDGGRRVAGEDCQTGSYGRRVGLIPSPLKPSPSAWSSSRGRRFPPIQMHPLKRLVSSSSSSDSSGSFWSASCT